MKPFILFLLTLSLFIGESQAQKQKCKDCIEWSQNRKLAWSDFKGRPNKISRNEALTDSGISIGLKCDSRASEVTIECFFDRSKSWAKNNRTDYLLAHEQLHFDITELFARKLRKQIAKLGNDCKKLNNHSEIYYNQNHKELVAYQLAYDADSNHSLNNEKQAYWEERIARELEKLKPYASLANN